MSIKNFSFELITGDKFVALKSGKKLFVVEVTDKGLKFSSGTLDDFFKTVKVYSNNRNR